MSKSRLEEAKRQKGDISKKKKKKGPQAEKKMPCPLGWNRKKKNPSPEKLPFTGKAARSYREQIHPKEPWENIQGPPEHQHNLSEGHEKAEGTLRASFLRPLQKEIPGDTKTAPAIRSTFAEVVIHRGVHPCQGEVVRGKPTQNKRDEGKRTQIIFRGCTGYRKRCCPRI